MRTFLGRLHVLLQRLRFRYDVFISYARRDSSAYAVRLKEELEKVDFTCFLDQHELPAGDALNASLKRAVRRSARLVLLGTPGAAASEHVPRELEEFEKTRRPVIPIAFQGSLTETAWPSLRVRDVIWIDETMESLTRGVPSPVVASSIDRAFDLRKLNSVRRMQVIAVTFLVFTGASIAAWMIARATTARQDAIKKFNSARIAADTSAAQSKEEKRRADSAIDTARDATAAAAAANLKARRNIDLADERALDLAQEEGRLELLRGERPRALASLAKAYVARPGDDVLRYLVASAARGLETKIDAGYPMGLVDDADISPDGARVVTLRHSPRLWDLHGRVITALRRPGEHDDQTTTIARFADNGRLLLTGGMHGLSAWRASDGRWLRDLRGTAGLAVHDIAAPIDGTRVLVTAGEKTYLVDVDTGNATPLGRGTWCQGFMPCANSYLLLAAKRPLCAVADGDGGISLFQMTNAAPLRSFDAAALTRAFGPDTPPARKIAPIAALSADGSTLAVVSPSGKQVALLDTAAGARIALLSVTTPESKSASAQESFGRLHLQFAGDGRRLVVGGFGEVQVWDYLDGEERWASTPLCRIPGNQFRVSADGLRLMVVGGSSDPASRFDYNVHIHDLDSGALIATRPLQGYFIGGHWTADGQRLLAIAQMDPVVHVWHAALDDRITAHVRAVNSANVAVAADGRSLVVAVKGSLRRLDTVTGTELGRIVLPPQQASFYGGSNPIDTRGAISANGVRGLIAIANETYAFDISRAYLKAENLGNHPSISPDGNWIAMTEGQKILIRPFVGGRSRVVTADGTVLSFAFSPGGNLLIVKSADSVAAYAVRSGGSRYRVPVKACFDEISPDEQWLAIADCPSMPSNRGALRLVSLTGARPPFAFSSVDYTQVLNSPEGTRSFFVFSDDSRRLVIAAHGDPLSIWSVADGKLLQTLPVRGADTMPAFDSEGERLAVIDETTLRMYDVRRGSLIGLFASSGRRFCKVAFVGDGDQLTAVTCRWNTPLETTPLGAWWRTEVPVWNTARERRSPDEIRRLVGLTQ
jgi:WD40 repeat protein